MSLSGQLPATAKQPVPNGVNYPTVTQMKTTSVPLWLLAATLIASAGGAAEKPAVPMPILDWSDEALVARYDTNKNGRLDEAEITVIRTERLLMSGDSHDLGSPEAHARAKEKEAARIMERAAELERKLEEAKQRRRQLMRERRELQLVRDEELERSDLILLRMQDPDPRRAAVIRRFDKDGDGSLSSEERLSLNDVYRGILDRR
jgi:hypothetical protein